MCESKPLWVQTELKTGDRLTILSIADLLIALKSIDLLITLKTADLGIPLNLDHKHIEERGRYALVCSGVSE